MSPTTLADIYQLSVMFLLIVEKYIWAKSYSYDNNVLHNSKHLTTPKLRILCKILNIINGDLHRVTHAFFGAMDSLKYSHNSVVMNHTYFCFKIQHSERSPPISFS